LFIKSNVVILLHKVKRYAREQNINIHTLKEILGGRNTSKPIVDLLVKQGYIKDANELRKKSN